MPTIPQKATLSKMKSVDIINVTRNELGQSFQNLIPAVLKVGEVMPNGNIATYDDALNSLRAVGNVLMQFVPKQNDFLNAIVNRIGRVIITSKLYENPYKRFKKGLLEYGETVEEIFVQIAKPFQFNVAGTENEVFKKHIPDVKAAFHSMNYQKYYPVTVSNDQLRQAFLSFEGITDLIGRIIEQVYTAANYDEFLMFKYLIARMALAGNIASVNVPQVTVDNARDVTTTMVEYAKNLTYMDDKYNMARVLNYTDKSYLNIILNTKADSIFDVNVLALSFNMEKAELLGQKVSIDSFANINSARLEELFKDDPYTTYVPFTDEELAKLSSIVGLMVDSDWFMIFDNFYNMTEIYNPQNLYWNYFYHVWKTFSVSPYANAILFTTDTPTVTSVAITPSTMTIAKGSQGQFLAIVETTGFASKAVVWSLSGTNTVESAVSVDGTVTISSAETNTTITLTATSVADPTKKATATITVG